MNFDDRVKAVAKFGFTDRQARFLVTVMLHAGVCVPRQYARFAGTAYGHNVTKFFDRLVQRRFVRVCRCVHNRAELYHVRYQPLYSAIGQPQSRYRRPVSGRLALGRVVFLDGSGREVPRPRAGYLSQRSTLTADAPLSGLDLVSLSLSPKAGFRGLDHVTEEARSALVRAGLPADRVELPVGRLSGGQRQRVLLARAIAGSPSLIVLDEPDTALDAAGLATLRRLVAEEVAAGRTVVYVTHDSDAMGGADAVFHVDGTVVSESVAAR